MLVLLTHPESFPEEAKLLNRMLAANRQFSLHLRKPGMDRDSFKQLLISIDAVHHPRIVLHQHHELDRDYNLKGLHFTAADRQSRTRNERIISTSFHTLEEAEAFGKPYACFFCSPVFQSISKPGYAGSEDWTIVNTSSEFTNKAVALGGIDLNTLLPAKEKGFLHVAVLGAVWGANNPETALLNILHNWVDAPENTSNH